jgi:hypothetical protein
VLQIIAYIKSMGGPGATANATGTK